MKKKYWYLTSYFICPVCGREKVHKERKYTAKPTDPYLRYEHINDYDYCDV